MAIDKAIDSAKLESNLTSIADAIRSKGGTSGELAFPAGFVSAIAAISTGGEYHDGVLVSGEVTIESNNTSFGIEMDKPEGWENGTVPTLACLYNKTYTKVITEEGQLDCRTLVLLASKNGVGVRYNQSASNTGGGIASDPAEICKWYGSKLWFYASADSNFKSLRAGDTYGWFYIL